MICINNIIDERVSRGVSGRWCLTIGKVYEIDECEWPSPEWITTEQRWSENTGDKFFKVINDVGNSFYYKQNLFVSTKEYRKRKLRKLSEL